MAEFELDPRLANNSVVFDWPLCTVFLENDARFPWLVLVPRRAGMQEVFQLKADDRTQFFHEMNVAAERLSDALNPSKMNVAMLGNMVPQLHAHVIARFATDPAWPSPVWGVGARRAYDEAELDVRLARMKDIVGQNPGSPKP